MNTRSKIINLLSKSKEPLGPKKIALELKKPLQIYGKSYQIYIWKERLKRPVLVNINQV